MSFLQENENAGTRLIIAMPTSPIRLSIAALLNACFVLGAL